MHLIKMRNLIPAHNNNNLSLHQQRREPAKQTGTSKSKVNLKKKPYENSVPETTK